MSDTVKAVIAALRTKSDAARERAAAAEARQAELEELVAEKGRRAEALDERLGLARQASVTLKHYVPVLQRLRDTEIKLEQRSMKADAAETRSDALDAQIDELQAKYDALRKENKELHAMLAELDI